MVNVEYNVCTPIQQASQDAVPNWDGKHGQQDCSDLAYRYSIVFNVHAYKEDIERKSLTNSILYQKPG